MGSHENIGINNNSYIFDFHDFKGNTLTASPDVEVKLRCSDNRLDIELETNDIPYSIPRFKEEVYIKIQFTQTSQMIEETHYKARHETEEFHDSCWYKSRVNICIECKPLKYTSTFYLIPKDETCTSEVEFWMTGTKRRSSTKEEYFNRIISQDEMPMLEQLGVI